MARSSPIRTARRRTNGVVMTPELIQASHRTSGDRAFPVTPSRMRSLTVIPSLWFPQPNSSNFKLIDGLLVRFPALYVSGARDRKSTSILDVPNRTINGFLSDGLQPPCLPRNTPSSC